MKLIHNARMGTSIHRWYWKTFLLDILFPPYCLGCGSLGTAFCAICISRIPLSETGCLLCGARNETGKPCASCRQRLPFLRAIYWATSYDHPFVQEAIARYKYRGDRSLALPLASLIVSFLKKQTQGNVFCIPPNSVLLPLPLHKRKQRERGFNQSELLAHALAEKIHIPTLPPPALLRTLYTSPQAAQSKELRKENVENAFVVPVSSEYIVKGKVIVLVDDVATTGNTLSAAAVALKKAGAKKVLGIVVARG